MILRTSAVAVCCCNNSLKSSVRFFTSSNCRAFSIAITAWSAKVVSSSICLSEIGDLVPSSQSRRYLWPSRLQMPEWDEIQLDALFNETASV